MIPGIMKCEANISDEETLRNELLSASGLTFETTDNEEECHLENFNHWMDKPVSFRWDTTDIENIDVLEYIDNWKPTAFEVISIYTHILHLGSYTNIRMTGFLEDDPLIHIEGNNLANKKGKWINEEGLISFRYAIQENDEIYDLYTKFCKVSENQVQIYLISSLLNDVMEVIDLEIPKSIKNFREVSDCLEKALIKIMQYRRSLSHSLRRKLNQFAPYYPPYYGNNPWYFNSTYNQTCYTCNGRGFVSNNYYQNYYPGASPNPSWGMDHNTAFFPDSHNNFNMNSNSKNIIFGNSNPSIAKNLHLLPKTSITNPLSSLFQNNSSNAQSNVSAVNGQLSNINTSSASSLNTVPMSNLSFSSNANLNMNQAQTLAGNNMNGFNSSVQNKVQKKSTQIQQLQTRATSIQKMGSNQQVASNMGNSVQSRDGQQFSQNVQSFNSMSRSQNMSNIAQASIVPRHAQSVFGNINQDSQGFNQTLNQGFGQGTSNHRYNNQVSNLGESQNFGTNLRSDFGQTSKSFRSQNYNNNLQTQNRSISNIFGGQMINTERPGLRNQVAFQPQDSNLSFHQNEQQDEEGDSIMN